MIRLVDQLIIENENQKEETIDLSPDEEFQRLEEICEIILNNHIKYKID